MRIAILHMRYLPELTGTGPLVAELASDLAARGEEVTVITSMPHYGLRTPGRSGGPAGEGHERGVRVVRTLAFPYGSGRALGRAVDYGLYAALSTFSGLAMSKPDVLLAVAPPISVGVSAWLVGIARRAPIVFNAQDIWPDGLISMGKLHNPLLVRVFRWLESFTYRASRRVTVLSEGMRENLLQKGVPAAKVAVLPNWVDLEAIRPVERSNAFRRELDVEGKFVVLFAGNLGFAAGLETVLRAADLLRKEGDIVFLLVGEGSAKEGLRAMARELALENVRFVTSQPRSRLAEVLGAADLSLVPLRSGMGSLSVPSKTMAIMASGRPVLAAVPSDSEVRRVVDQAGCGRWIEAEDPASMAAEIVRLRADPDGLQSLGLSGRRYAEAHFGRREIVARHHRLLREVALERSAG